MRFTLLCSLLGLCMSSIDASMHDMHDMDHKMAVCKFEGSVSGTVMIHHLEDNMKNIHFMGKLMNIPEGKHGFHVHEKGDLGNSCKNAGSHYNPKEVVHGDLTSDTRHEGDLGNIMVDKDNSTKIDITLKDVELKDFINRSIVVHEKEDDLGNGDNEESKKTGNAGSRLDCCKIMWQKKDDGNAAPSTKLSIALVALGLVMKFL